MNNKWFARKLMNAANHETPWDIRRYAVPHHKPHAAPHPAVTPDAMPPPAPEAPEGGEEAIIRQMLQHHRDTNAEGRVDVTISLERPAHELPHAEWKNASSYRFLTPSGAECAHMRADLYLEMHALIIEVLKDRSGYLHQPRMREIGPRILYETQLDVFLRYEHGPVCGRHVLSDGSGEVFCRTVAFTPAVSQSLQGAQHRVYSLLVNRRIDVTGRVHVCVLSGRVHICEQGLCQREIYSAEEGQYVCELTAAVKDNALSRTAEKLWGHSARVTSDRDGRKHAADADEGGVGFEQVHVELLGWHAPIERDPLLPAPTTVASRRPDWKVVKPATGGERPGASAETQSLLYYLGRSETGYGSMLASLAHGGGVPEQAAAKPVRLPSPSPPLQSTAQQQPPSKKKKSIETVPSRPAGSDKDLVRMCISKSMFEADFYTQGVVDHVRRGLVALDQGHRKQEPSLFAHLNGLREQEPLLELGALLFYALDGEARTETVLSFFHAYQDRLTAYLLAHAAALRAGGVMADNDKVTFLRVLCLQLFSVTPQHQRFLIPMSELFLNKIVLGEAAKTHVARAGYTYKPFKGYQHPNISF